MTLYMFHRSGISKIEKSICSDMPARLSCEYGQTINRIWAKIWKNALLGQKKLFGSCNPPDPLKTSRLLTFYWLGAPNIYISRNPSKCKGIYRFVGLF